MQGGNKEGIEADFTPPIETLAFSIVVEGETDLTERWPGPLPEVIKVFESANTFQEVADNLSDIKIIKY